MLKSKLLIALCFLCSTAFIGCVEGDGKWDPIQITVNGSRCNMAAIRCSKPSLSFFDKLRGKRTPTYYPDIVIDNYHGTKGEKAYYIVLPKGTPVRANNCNTKVIQNGSDKIMSTNKGDCSSNVRIHQEILPKGVEIS